MASSRSMNASLASIANSIDEASGFSMPTVINSLRPMSCTIAKAFPCSLASLEAVSRSRPARGALMKPFQPRCPSAQIERKWPATKDYFSFGEEAIAFLAGPRSRGAWCQVACRGEGRPRFANFPVIPAPGVGQFDRRIDCLNLRSIFGADVLNTQDVDPLHGRFPEPLTWNKRMMVHRRRIC